MKVFTRFYLYKQGMWQPIRENMQPISAIVSSDILSCLTHENQITMDNWTMTPSYSAYTSECAILCINLIKAIVLLHYNCTTQCTQGINIYKYNNYHVTAVLFIYIMYADRSPGLLGPTEREYNNGQENNTFTSKVFSSDTWNHLNPTRVHTQWTQLTGQASQWPWPWHR